MADLPGSVLFACDHNAIRSPMAEALAKKMLGSRLYIQSVGVDGEMEIDLMRDGEAVEASAPIIAGRQAMIRVFIDVDDVGKVAEGLTIEALELNDGSTARLGTESQHDGEAE